jgi:hypothetical protein
MIYIFIFSDYCKYFYPWGIQSLLDTGTSRCQSSLRVRCLSCPRPRWGWSCLAWVTNHILKLLVHLRKIIVCGTGPIILGMRAMILGLRSYVLRLATIQVSSGRLLPCWTRLLLLFRWQTLSWRRLHSQSENNSQLQASRRKKGSTNRTSGIFRFIDASSCLVGTRNQDRGRAGHV